MKRIILYVLILGAALLQRVEGTDVGKLIPVELVQLYKEGDAVVVETDLGESGTGTTVKQAIENLKETTAGIIYLDTADYLLVEQDAREEAIRLKNYLRPSVRVCISTVETDLKEATKYLRVHKPKAKLETFGLQQNTEHLIKEDGKLLLEEK